MPPRRNASPPSKPAWLCRDSGTTRSRLSRTVGELKSLHAVVKPLEDTDSSVEDLDAMIEMAAEDESFATEVPSEVKRLEVALEDLELKALLSGPHDGAGAIVTINARDGGTDANDWAEMLLRMYTQWAQRREFSHRTAGS